MEELVQADGEELERVDEHSCSWDVPECKYYDGEDHNLDIGE